MPAVDKGGWSRRVEKQGESSDCSIGLTTVKRKQRKEGCVGRTSGCSPGLRTCQAQPMGCPRVKTEKYMPDRNPQPHSYYQSLGGNCLKEVWPKRDTVADTKGTAA